MRMSSGAVGAEGEAARRVVELRRGHAQVEQHAVHACAAAAPAPASENCVRTNGKRGSANAARRALGLRVPVERDQAARAARAARGSRGCGRRGRRCRRRRSRRASTASASIASGASTGMCMPGAHSEKSSMPAGGVAEPASAWSSLALTRRRNPRARSSGPGPTIIASRSSLACRRSAGERRMRPEPSGATCSSKPSSSALPPARLRMEAGERLDLRRAPAPTQRSGYIEHAAVGVRSEH